MANINDVHDTSEFTRTLKLAGTLFNGVVLGSDDNLYKYSKDGESIVNEFESDLSTDQWESLLTGAKVMRLEHMDEEFDLFLDNGFEYPTSSGNYFSINASARGYLANLMVGLSGLTFPLLYNGIGEATVTFANSTEAQTFYSTALTAHETERLTNKVPADALIRAISSVSIDNARIDSVYLINY